ncbi:MAG: hypothetical protein ACFB9M_08105 [Myxococcota bacterium]
MSRKYDFVVLGGRLSSVLVASLLTKRGFRGVLLDQGELSTALGGADELLVNPAGSFIMDRVHDELGVRDDYNRICRPLKPALQFVLPETRFDFVGGTQIDELARGMGISSDAIRSCFEAMLRADRSIGTYLSEIQEIPPPTGFFARLTSTSARKVDALTHLVQDSAAGQEPMLRDLFGGLIPFLTFLDPRRAEHWTEARWVRPVARLLGGGFQTLSTTGDRDLFLDVARRKSLDVRPGAVERLVPEGRSWLVYTSGGRDPILTSSVVDASTDLSGLDAVPPRQQGRHLPVLMQAAKARGSLHLLGIELDQAALPPPLGTHILLFNQRRDPNRVEPWDPASVDRPIWITTRPGLQEGRCQLILQHPISAVQAHESRTVPLDDVLKARLRRLIPFLDEARPEVFNPTQSGRMGPPVLGHPHFDVSLDEETGLGGVSMRTSFKNLFLAGPCVVPGLGREGEYIAAAQAAKTIEVLLAGSRSRSLV